VGPGGALEADSRRWAASRWMPSNPAITDVLMVTMAEIRRVAATIPGTA
jgi:hypothetical protein